MHLASTRILQPHMHLSPFRQLCSQSRALHLYITTSCTVYPRKTLYTYTKDPILNKLHIGLLYIVIGSRFPLNYNIDNNSSITGAFNTSLSLLDKSYGQKNKSDNRIKLHYASNDLTPIYTYMYIYNKFHLITKKIHLIQ